jgi:hypothetical protein
VVRGLSDFDLSEHTYRKFTFIIDEAVLSGTLITPKDAIAPPIAIIVHGDGAQNRFQMGDIFRLFVLRSMLVLVCFHGTRLGSEQAPATG